MTLYSCLAIIRSACEATWWATSSEIASCRTRLARALRNSERQSRGAAQTGSFRWTASAIDVRGPWIQKYTSDGPPASFIVAPESGLGCGALAIVLLNRTVSVFHFELRSLPPEAEAFREEVRAFLRQALGDRSSVRRARSWGGFDPEFS